MALDGIGGHKPVNKDKPQTMETLNIKEGSKEASIFNEVDIDKDGSLNKFEYFNYMKKVQIAQIEELENERLGKKEKELNEKFKFIESLSFLKNKYPDVEIDKSNNTITIKSLGIEKFPLKNSEDIQNLKTIILIKEEHIKINNGIYNVEPRFGLD